MNAHDYAIERQLDAALIKLIDLFNGCQNKDDHGCHCIRVPKPLVREFERLWTERSRAIAREAELADTPQWVSGPMRVDGQVVA